MITAPAIPRLDFGGLRVRNHPVVTGVTNVVPAQIMKQKRRGAMSFLRDFAGSLKVFFIEKIVMVLNSASDGCWS